MDRCRIKFEKTTKKYENLYNKNIYIKNQNRHTRLHDDKFDLNVPA